MHINEIINTTLAPLGVPICPDLYTGQEKEWITYNIVNDKGTQSSDNDPEVNELYLNIHYFLPATKNYFVAKDTIRQLLYDNDFDYPEVEMNTIEDGTVRHIVFTTTYYEWRK